MKRKNGNDLTIAMLGDDGISMPLQEAIPLRETKVLVRFGICTKNIGYYLSNNTSRLYLE